MASELDIVKLLRRIRFFKVAIKRELDENRVIELKNEVKRLPIDKISIQNSGDRLSARVYPHKDFNQTAINTTTHQDIGIEDNLQNIDDDPQTPSHSAYREEHLKLGL